MTGKLTAAGNTVNLDTQPSDTLENLDKVDFIGEVHIEVGHGRWDFMLDPTYLKLSTNVGFGPISAGLSPELAIIDFGAYYSVLQHAAINGAPNPIVFQVFAGGRYFHMGAEVSPKKLPTISGSASFIAPMLGARIKLPVDPNFTFVLRGDYGGFGVDHASSTWSAAILGKVHMYKCLSFAVGYRLLGIDYSENNSGMDGTLYGPVIGVIFKF